METLLTNLRPAVPTKPGTYLWRGNLASGFPFVLVRVTRRWWLFGEVGLRSHEDFMPATRWNAQHWRVPV